MIWVYTEDVDRFVDSLKWSTYGKIFKNVWAASAFKGAFGERLFTVNLQVKSNLIVIQRCTSFNEIMLLNPETRR